jgi:hypothetical protein
MKRKAGAFCEARRADLSLELVFAHRFPSKFIRLVYQYRPGRHSGSGPFRERERGSTVALPENSESPMLSASFDGGGGEKEWAIQWPDRVPVPIREW